MPQVAQQDYLRIAPKLGRGIVSDAAGLARIKQLMQRGTIFDAQIIAFFEGESEDSGNIGRVLSCYIDTNLNVYDGYNNKILSLYLPYTVEQYEGLSAVQLAEDDYFGEVVTVLPRLSISNTFLSETEQAALICVDDCKLIPTASGGNLTALSISQDKVDPDNDDFVNITWEDAKKLIGLPIISA